MQPKKQKSDDIPNKDITNGMKEAKSDSKGDSKGESKESKKDGKEAKEQKDSKTKEQKEQKDQKDSQQPKEQKGERSEKGDKGSNAQNNAPEVLIVHNKTFDLVKYAKPYTGIIKVQRLLFIAEHCPELQLEAFRQAITELKNTSNTALYLECVSRAREIFVDKLGDQWGLDQRWVTAVNRQATEKLTNLEVALNNAKREGDKEPIRRAYDALAEHYISRGDFTNALTKYLDSKDANPESLDTCLNIIRTSIFIGSMSDVKNQVMRAQSTHSAQLKDNPIKIAQLNASLGLYNLKVGNFRQAAQSFLTTTKDIDTNYAEVISSREVAIYGSICALATYGRTALKDEVLNNSNFKYFLEIVPVWRKIIMDFQTSKYTTCFQNLEKIKNDLLLDLYLSPHVNKMYNAIRDKALIQYFKPFVSVKLSSMAAAFNMDIPTLEKQLASLIAENKIQARIDSHSKVLHARHADQRSGTFETALNMGNRYIRDAKALLLRMSLVENDFVLRPERRTRREGEEDGKRAQNM